MARRGNRYENSGVVVDQWYDKHEEYGQMASTFDICWRCFKQFGNDLLADEIGDVQPYGMNEPVGDSLDFIFERPDYADGEYTCASCNVMLRD